MIGRTAAQLIQEFLGAVQACFFRDLHMPAGKAAPAAGRPATKQVTLATARSAAFSAKQAGDPRQALAEGVGNGVGRPLQGIDSTSLLIHGVSETARTQRAGRIAHCLIGLGKRRRDALQELCRTPD